MTLKDLLDKVKTYNEKANFDLIKKAFYYAQEAHGDQLRVNGEEWMQHPLKTADRLADCELSDRLIAAALLHDIVEDTPITIQKVQKSFGREVARLVNGVTKVSAVQYQGAKKFLEKLQRLFILMAADPQVILIKLADRLHNLQTLDVLPREQRKRIAQESLEVFAPIADRLGMGQIRGEIEDLSFQFSHPQEYRWVKKVADQRIQQQLPYLKKMQKKLNRLLNKTDVQVKDVHLRSKHYYSLYQKLLKHNSNIDRIYDLNVIRLIVGTEKQCYNALGVIHDLWRPLKGHIKDYIAQPKANGYQSLHTTVLTKTQIVEFQIRTDSMHQQAEKGLVALLTSKKRKVAENLPLIKEIKKIQKEFRGGKRYLDILKTDVFQRHIVIFTPHGDIITLPEEASPIDFAYKIHTDIGNKCQQAKVNDKTVPLGTKLKSGDVVEIITDPRKKKPDKKWLKLAKTQYAQHHINHALTK